MRRFLCLLALPGAVSAEVPGAASAKVPGGAAAADRAAPPASWDAQLFLHSNATAAKFNARCLDGSNGGMYFRPASSAAAATKWKFHFQGGGWCTSAKDCLGRSTGLLGSSASWPPTLSAFWGGAAGFSGLMSAAVNETGDDVGNPFGDWNFVWLAYCDGSSQTSDRDAPLRVQRGDGGGTGGGSGGGSGGGTGDVAELHMRGRALLDAHLHELETAHAFLSSATEVVVSGTSAGGMSTFMHSSFLKSQLRTSGARLVAVPDAGFWWDTPKYGAPAEHKWLDSMAQAIVPGLWNATLRGGGNARCLGAPPSGDRAKCFSQPYAYGYGLEDVPTFVVQSLVDPANMGFCWGPPCRIKGNTPGTCTPAQLGDIAAYSAALKGNITAAQQPFGARDGHFLTSCNQHEETCRQTDWWGISIGGQTMNSTFYTWYTQGGGAAGASAADVPWPGDGSCHSGSHGNC